MTQEQYQQMMLERQAMEQEQMMQPQGPGVAGGFMGGLLDSALAGLLPNQQYLNPQNPGNAGAAQMGGLIGMIIPMLLAKWGIKNMALPALAKEGGMLAKYLPKLGEEAMTANTGYKADMLASILGGGIGGGLAEGPMGGLLGAAGMAGYSKFRGAGAVDDAGKLNLGELFSNKPPKAPPTTPAGTTGAVKEGVDPMLDNVAKATEDVTKAYRAKVPNVYNPKTGEINLTSVIDDTATKFDEKQLGKIVIDGEEMLITPRGVIEGLQSNANKTIQFSKATKSGVKGDRTPKYDEYKSMTFKDLYEYMITPFKAAKTVKGGKKTTEIDNWLWASMNKPIEVSTKGGITQATRLENTIYKTFNLPGYQPTAKLYGSNRAASSKLSSKASEKLSSMGAKEAPESEQDAILQAMQAGE